MAKYYVSSGKCKLLVSSAYPVLAATFAVYTWQVAKKKFGKIVYVSEVGFQGGEHPHHEKDHAIDVNFIKNLIS